MIIVIAISFIIGILFEKCLEILKKGDPVHNCDVYKKLGCSHVDGVECDMKTCSILTDYRLKELQLKVVPYKIER